MKNLIKNLFKNLKLGILIILCFIVKIFKFLISKLFNSKQSILLLKNLINKIRLLLKLVNKILNITIQNINKIFQNIDKKLYSIIRSKDLELEVLDIKKDLHRDRYIITLNYNSSLAGKDFTEAIWNSLTELDIWNYYNKKIIMIAIKDSLIKTNKPGESNSYYITRNIAITKETTFEEYYGNVKKPFEMFSSQYQVYNFNLIEVQMWNADTKKPTVKNILKSSLKYRSYSTIAKPLNEVEIENIDKNKDPNLIMGKSINPLKRGFKKGEGVICALDIETISINNEQFPIAISFAYRKSKNISSFVTLIDVNLFKEDKYLAVSKMWNEFFNILKNLNLSKNLFIYCHNLGSFDGYLLLKPLYEFAGDRHQDVNSLIDEAKKFITIQYSYNIIEGDPTFKEIDLSQIKEEEEIPDFDIYNWKFLDSYRLFPVSLDGLAKVFNVQGKISKYNLEWNDIKFFDNSELLKAFIIYSEQDAVSLLETILKARDIYIEKYNMDITRAVSAPSLSMLIYRKNFQIDVIPTLTRQQDKFVRQSYTGGSSDFYAFHAKNVYYYDVNSLYPYVMKKEMPYEIEYISYGEDLNNIFGFVEAIVECPDSVKTPILPYKYEGKLIHPYGKWKDTYFSEELKLAVSLGYKVKVLEAQHWTKKILFDKYIDHFYELKKNSTGAERYIAKLHLNSFYGIFGRSKNTLATISIENKYAWNIVSKYPVKTHTEINDNLSLFLIYESLDFDLINKLKVELNINDFMTTLSTVKSQVAIAAAVTSYARMEMVKYKTLNNVSVLYSDTNSIFTDKPLPDIFIGKELGQMKNELGEGYIKKAYFFGIKQYAYIDNENNIKSVFSGVPRNKITWEEVLQIAERKKVYKTIPTQFFKSLVKMNISILPKVVELVFNSDKLLIGNDFQPLEINETKIVDRLRQTLITSITKKLNYIRKKLNKNPLYVISKTGIIPALPSERCQFESDMAYIFYYMSWLN